MIPASSGGTVSRAIGQRRVGEGGQHSTKPGRCLPSVTLLSDEREARVYVDIVEGLANYIDVTIAGKTLLVYWEDLPAEGDSNADPGAGSSGREYLLAEVSLPFRVDAEGAVADMEGSVFRVTFPRLGWTRLS